LIILQTFTNKNTSVDRKTIGIKTVQKEDWEGTRREINVKYTAMYSIL